MYILQFLYLFSYKWIFRLFSAFYYHQQCCYEHYSESLLVFQGIYLVVGLLCCKLKILWSFVVWLFFKGEVKFCSRRTKEETAGGLSSAQPLSYCPMPFSFDSKCAYSTQQNKSPTVYPTFLSRRAFRNQQ